jgi:hypothetical protein
VLGLCRFPGFGPTVHATPPGARGAVALQFASQRWEAATYRLCPPDSAMRVSCSQPKGADVVGVTDPAECNRVGEHGL